MERLPHVFLAGDGAARFARELGMEREAATDETRRIWQDGVDGSLPGKLALFRGQLAQRRPSQPTPSTSRARSTSSPATSVAISRSP